MDRIERHNHRPTELTFAANPRHLVHLLTANIAELPLDGLLLRPTMRHRVLELEIK